MAGLKLLIFGGTTEGRVLAEELSAMGAEVTVSVATEVGAEELRGLRDVSIVCGRRDDSEKQALLQGFDLCVDATHPYADEATESIRLAAQRAGCPLLRLVRQESSLEQQELVTVPSFEAACEYLSRQQGRILLTTGSKEIAAFASLGAERLFARVLPTHEALELCEAQGLPHRNILALYGPFTQAMNEAMLEQYQIRWLVTKDGGAAGGTPEKLAAARAKGVGVVLITRPQDSGLGMEELIRTIREEWLCRSH